jgi:AbrB family looped-hinge helix DNA binding protein
VSRTRYTIHIGERGRFVLPAEIRRHLQVGEGDVLVLDLETDTETVLLRKAADAARTARGLFRDLAPAQDLTAELIQDRRAESEREEATEPTRR